jgi:hypothetical protein
MSRRRPTHVGRYAQSPPPADLRRPPGVWPIFRARKRQRRDLITACGQRPYLTTRVATPEAGGFQARNRWLSAATPPGSTEKTRKHPGWGARSMGRLAPLPGCFRSKTRCRWYRSFLARPPASGWESLRLSTARELAKLLGKPPAFNGTGIGQTPGKARLSLAPNWQAGYRALETGQTPGCRRESPGSGLHARTCARDVGRLPRRDIGRTTNHQPPRGKGGAAGRSGQILPRPNFFAPRNYGMAQVTVGRPQFYRTRPCGGDRSINLKSR